MSTPGELTIGQLAERTGLAPATLRMWEARYGVPAPRRLPGGHRRYSEEDAATVLEALRARGTGLSLAAALEQARERQEAAPADSIYAGLRRAWPDLQPAVYPKRVLNALSEAIEDECCARAERGLLFGSFQQARLYRSSEPRWRQFARTAELAIVFADFRRVRRREGAPVEVPIARRSSFGREWTVICDAPGYSACLAAWEPPTVAPLPDRARRFEALWSAEPSVVRSATSIAWQIARDGLPELPETPPGLRPLAPPGPAELHRATALANRMLAYVSARAPEAAA